MGHTHGGGAHTHDGGGGGGLAIIVLIIVAAAIVGPAVAATASAVGAAVAELVHIVLIIVAVTFGVAVAGVCVLVGVRVRRWHLNHPVRQHVAAPVPRRTVQAIVESSEVTGAERAAVEAPRARWLYAVRPGVRETSARDRPGLGR